MSNRRRSQVKRQAPPCPDPSGSFCASSSATTSVRPPCVTSDSGTTCVVTASASTTTTPASASTSTLVSPTSTPPTSSAAATQSSSTPSAIDTAASSSPNAGTIAGSVVGGVVFLALVVLAVVLYLRVRKRRRTPPSSEFMNSLRDGVTPVLRLESGAEYTPALPEKGGLHTRYSALPLPLSQSSFHSSPPMQDVKFADEVMMTDVSSRSPSVERPLQPQRFSAQQASEPFIPHTSTSVGSRRELWGSETEIISGELSPIRRSAQSPPRVDSVLHFAPRFSLDELTLQPLRLSHSPTSLQPLRRQPDQE